MWKYFYTNGTYKWIDVLDQLVSNYNGTRHSTILMKPEDVSKNNEAAVSTTIFGHRFAESPLPIFKVDETVRISKIKYKSIFIKGYEANFTEEQFKIAKVIRRDSNVYDLVDHEGQPIIDKFYEEGLSAVYKKDNVYRVEKVLKSKKVRSKKMVLVKWLGYDSKHKSWIPESDISYCIWLKEDSMTWRWESVGSGPEIVTTNNYRLSTTH